LVWVAAAVVVVVVVSEAQRGKLLHALRGRDHTNKQTHEHTNTITPPQIFDQMGVRYRERARVREREIEIERDQTMSLVRNERLPHTHTEESVRERERAKEERHVRARDWLSRCGV